jgi:hypothetical protein
MAIDYVQRLKRDSGAYLHTLDAHPELGSIVRGEASASQYERFLEQTFHYVHWSGPILATRGEQIYESGRYPWLV